MPPAATEKKSADARENPLARIFDGLLALSAALALWFELTYLFQRIGLPYQLDYEEGNILNAALRLTHGVTPYPDPHAFPNALNPYGPVPYVLVAAAVKLGGLRFLLPRMMVFASLVAVAGVIARFVYRQSRSRLTAFAFGAVFMCVPLVEDWSPVLRVDLLGLAFSVIGLAVFAEHVGGGEKDRPLLAAPWFTLAIFTKYTFVAAPAACLLLLIVRRRWRLAARFVGIGMAIGAVGFGLMQLATHGRFAFHMFGTHADPFSFAMYQRKMADLLVAHWLLLALAAFGIASQWARREVTAAQLWLLMAAVTSLTAGKAGSNGNHFLEFLAALALCAGLGYAELRRRITRPAPALLASGVAALLLCLFVLSAGPIVDPAGRTGGCGEAYEYVHGHRGQNVLSENVGAVVLAGKPVFISNPFVYQFLVANAGWSDGPIVDAVRQHKFELVMLSAPIDRAPAPASIGERWSAAVVEALRQEYHPVRRFGCEDAQVALEPN
ncbi:MAG TPA: hypothetical protein VFA60_04285 [Terriglobales bacterium]|nr:hypothetical protein [Terriglobales bacterium]